MSDLDVLKFRLAEECNWECPYTGASIAMEALVGRHSQFDVEHIIPFSRSLDNSFANKTLCQVKENRDVKRKRTPNEAYAGSPQRYQEILARVKRFRGSAAHSKLRKFRQEGLDADFAQRQLQDTRYMSRLAGEYVGLLFGGQIDAGHCRRVQVSPGRITAFLRDQWGLNALLGGGDEKSREDHRHHAVDALVIALTDAGTIQLLSRAAEAAAERGCRLFVPFEKPWPGFVDEVKCSVDAINVSFRVNRRISGALHKDTLFSKPHKVIGGDGKAKEYRHVRKPLASMSADEIESIVDERVRKVVQDKLKDLGGDPKKAFADANNHPYMKAHDGRIIPIHKARIREAISVISLGEGGATRYAAPGANHHMEIVAVVDSQGNEKRWEAAGGDAVSLYEAARRRMPAKQSSGATRGRAES